MITDYIKRDTIIELISFVKIMLSYIYIIMSTVFPNFRVYDVEKYRSKLILYTTKNIQLQNIRVHRVN